jgi:hypothetical protein
MNCAYIFFFIVHHLKSRNKKGGVSSDRRTEAARRGESTATVSSLISTRSLTLHEELPDTEAAGTTRAKNFPDTNIF